MAEQERQERSIINTFATLCRLAVKRFARTGEMDSEFQGAKNSLKLRALQKREADLTVLEETEKVADKIQANEELKKLLRL